MKFILIFFLFCTTAYADGPGTPSEAYYAKALKLAQEKVTRDKEATTVRAGALSASPVSVLYGRPHVKGDTWTVAAWRFNRTIDMLRPAADVPATELKDPTLAGGGLFRFTVVGVRNSPAEIDIEIQQLSDMGFVPLDPKISKIVLTLDAGFRLIRKLYYVHGISKPFSVSPEGVHSPMTILELLPIDSIDIAGATREAASYPPRIPPEIRDYAHRFGFPPALSNCASLTQDDFFGRTIDALWCHGDPWPTYIKTENGMALLAGKDSR